MTDYVGEMKYLLLDGDKYKETATITIPVKQYGLGTGKVVVVRRVK